MRGLLVALTLISLVAVGAVAYGHIGPMMGVDGDL